MDPWEKLWNEIDGLTSTDPLRRELLGPGTFSTPEQVLEAIPLRKSFLGPRAWYKLIQPPGPGPKSRS